MSAVYSFLARSLWAMLPDCRETVRLASIRQDAASPLAVRWRAALHRALCPGCKRYAQQLELIGKAARRLPEVEGGLSREARTRLRSALTDPPEIAS